MPTSSCQAQGRRSDPGHPLSLSSRPHTQPRLQRMTMRTGLAALLLFSLAAVARAADPPAAAPAAGSLEVPEAVYDAGKIDRGVTVRHQFVLKNIGQAA